MSTKTADLTKHDTDALAAELARREQQAQQEADERAARLEQARREWATRTWEAREQIEADLTEQGRTAREEFSAAVKAGDLPAAFKAWMAERAARYARESVRNKGQRAAQALGKDVHRLADLRWYSPDFLARLEEEADQHARANGYDRAEELAPEMPTEPAPTTGA